MKTFLVTGASKGLGLTIVKSLLASNHIVYAINRKKTEDIEKFEKEFPNQLFFKPFDLINSSAVKAEIFGDGFIPLSIKLDGVVNNAALAYDDIITNLNLERLNDMFKVNVFSAMNIVKYGIRNMLYHRTKGSIVHISSISVHTGYKGLSMYAASKGALEAFSKNTAREWGGLGIRSNCLVAGFMETQMSATLTKDQKNRIYKRTSLKEPTDINSVANTVAFLLSENAISITGQNIFVDSGTI